MNIRPLHSRVVIRKQDEETTTAGGIVLPGSAQEKPTQGEVLAVGPGVTLQSGTVVELSVKVGDKVVFAEFAGTTIKHEGEDLLILNESDIFAVIA
ncbi:MAG: co-chaperone GroES [Saccharospirillaceae bacterium]|nr:co-chaperone GroES [Pseudomonadales bacterium]NRB78868.1 co-chaperone GroES [Saccharospirillaceae bacterium]